MHILEQNRDLCIRDAEQLFHRHRRGQRKARQRDGVACLSLRLHREAWIKYAELVLIDRPIAVDISLLVCVIIN